ncbi:amidase family protein [Acrocarpospora catenulata]|uniref:amidase family protein n=1 Tax=Acrocarpospora catenulata TaxID=2836182 RepID=UPI001BDA6A63|nr:amidase family protein [Acrocarpospora catenulata]
MHKVRSVLSLLALALSATLVPTAAQATAPNRPPHLDLETLTGAEAMALMAKGKLTSVELTKAYLERIDALNKRGPGLNAVTQLNPDVLKEAAAADKLRAKGQLLGPAHGLPVLLKDLIDVTGMYTSAGNYSLRKSYPATDAGITKKLRERGVVILGKVGLSEFANSFGSQPSGFSNLTGQVLHALDADQNPSGSSSGTGTAMAAALSTLGIGTETSGSIISPSNAQSLVGLRPTVGLVPGYGIAPISASQDIAGPMVRNVSDAALTLASIAGPDPEGDAAYAAMFGPDYIASGIIPALPAELPDYTKALDLDFVRGKKIGYNGTLTEGTPLKIAYDALTAAGAIMVSRPSVSVGTLPSLPSGYEQHKSIDEYYKRLGPQAPIKSLVEEVADNQANAHQALKFGNNNHLNSSQSDVTPGGANETAYRTNLVIRKAAWHKAINDMVTYPNSDPTQPADPVIAILGSVPNGPQAGYPTITIPMGYSATHRRAVAVQVHGNAYSEYNLLGVGYVIEQATRLRQPASAVNPSMYRCAQTDPPGPYAKRGHCNPDYDTVLKMIGGVPKALPFSLETESVQSLSARLAAGTLTSEDLVKAYLYRIALTNAEGPATQAVRLINPDALKEAREIDRERRDKDKDFKDEKVKYKDDVLKGKDKTPQAPKPLYGIPVLLNDGFDVAKLATTGGSIALQDFEPDRDSTVVAKLKEAGAIILGKTNITELNGVFDANMPKGYSSLAGQVLLPSDTDKTPAGSSSGSAAATASGLAAFTVGMETSADSAQLVAPAEAAGVVGLKPTVGLVSRTGVLPVARSQDAPGPITRTVSDAASALNVIAGPDSADPATAGAPVKDYTAGLSPTALQGKKIAVVASSAEPYLTMVAALQSLGATTTQVTVGTPDPNPASIVQSEFKRDLNAYLAGARRGPRPPTLQSIIDYNNANSVEGLKYQQGQLLTAQSVNLADPATSAAYQADLESGKAATRALIDKILTNGTADPADDFDAIMVPSGNALLGHAARAGYPALTIPAGYGAMASSAGRNPIGVTFIGTGYSEATLLADAYALEQATNIRQAPSYTNPSMWRCVPGSTFFTAELCHPGDRLLQSPSRN